MTDDHQQTYQEWRDEQMSKPDFLALYLEEKEKRKAGVLVDKNYRITCKNCGIHKHVVGDQIGYQLLHMALDLEVIHCRECDGTAWELENE